VSGNRPADDVERGQTGMTKDSLAHALEREHREIDAGIERFAVDPSSDGAEESLAAAVAALRRHIYLEEECVFPALSSGGLVAPIFVMLREHAQIWQTLDALECQIAADDLLGAANLCHQLLVPLQHHNLKEERVLYPETDRAVPAPGAERSIAFLESGRLPEGWVCIKARR
jgi:regulator of cell morphogenesis and NO signaling